MFRYINMILMLSEGYSIVGSVAVLHKRNQVEKHMVANKALIVLC